jgi:hypothetical protein
VFSKKSLDESQEKMTLDDSVIEDRDTPKSQVRKKIGTEDSILEKEEFPEKKLTSAEKKALKAVERKVTLPDDYPDDPEEDDYWNQAYGDFRQIQTIKPPPAHKRSKSHEKSGGTANFNQDDTLLDTNSSEYDRMAEKLNSQLDKLLFLKLQERDTVLTVENWKKIDYVDPQAKKEQLLECFGIKRRPRVGAKTSENYHTYADNCEIDPDVSRVEKLKTNGGKKCIMSSIQIAAEERRGNVVKQKLFDAFKKGIIYDFTPLIKLGGKIKGHELDKLLKEYTYQRDSANLPEDRLSMVNYFGNDKCMSHEPDYDNMSIREELQD